jgi:hypothetical protein
MAIQTPPPDALERAIDGLLGARTAPASLTVGHAYARLHDDTDGQTDPPHWLTLTLHSETQTQVTVGEHAFAFRTQAGEGRSPATARALWVLAEGIRRDNAARPRGPDGSERAQTVGTKAEPDPAMAEALNLILETAFFIPTLATEKGYRRQDDEAPDEQRAEGGRLSVYLAADCDVYVLGGWPSLRFREYFGGGQSLRTRNALMLLAEAMRRDTLANALVD